MDVVIPAAVGWKVVICRFDARDPETGYPVGDAFLIMDDVIAWRIASVAGDFHDGKDEVRPISIHGTPISTYWALRGPAGDFTAPLTGALSCEQVVVKQLVDNMMMDDFDFTSDAPGAWYEDGN